MGICWVSAPFQSWKQNPRGTLSFCCLCHGAQPILYRAPDTSNSNGSPVWEMPQALICFTNIFAF